MKEEIKKDKDALEMRLPIMETKMDASMIADMVTNLTNLSRKMYAIMERTTIQAEELAKKLKEQSSRQLLRDIKNDDIREGESITLSIEKELLSSTLDEEKITMEYDKMSLILEGEFQVLSFVENNERKVEPMLKTKQVEKKYPKLIVENVLVEVEDRFSHRFFNFLHGRGSTSFNYRKTFHFHKSSVD